MAVATMLASTALAAAAGQINTGGETGAYHATFCPQVESLLKKSKFDYRCTPSEGSRENIQRVIGDPSQLGLAQFDVFAHESQLLGGEELFAVVRSDIARECLFMVSRNPAFTSYGEVAALATQLRFVLPPEKSGSTGTFEYLQQADPEGLGLARDVTYAKTADEAIDLALAADDAVTLFVQFPDPKNARFKSVLERGGNIIPVIDRRILRQEVDGQKIYFAEETEVEFPKFLKTVDKLVTACTPMILFTGLASRIDGDDARSDHEDLIRTLQTAKLEQLQPKEGFFSKLWRRSKEMSAKSIEKVVEASETAREKAGPMMEDALKRAKEMTEQAKEGAKKVIEDLQKGSGDQGSSTTP
jgi:hypothetical protein